MCSVDFGWFAGVDSFVYQPLETTNAIERKSDRLASPASACLGGRNLTEHRRGVQVCLEGMIKQKYGKIVNITSQSEVIATKAHAACEGGSYD